MPYPFDLAGCSLNGIIFNRATVEVVSDNE